MERLQKYMSACGIASRRKSEELIKLGKVIVDGKVITELGFKVDGSETILVDGVDIKKEDKEYFLLYKPERTITSTKDEKGRKTVIDIIETKRKIFPVGRLDYDTSGVLILTNDGFLTNELTHPKKDIEKLYSAKIDGIITGEEIKQLSNGILLNGIMTKQAKVKLKKIDKRNNKSYVDITITEGRNHQVKDMFAFFGFKVLKLKRKKYAFLSLEGLKTGEYRRLNVKEVKNLYNLINTK